MPESENTRDSGALNAVIDRRLRRGGLALRKAFSRKVSITKLRAMKAEILCDIYKILVVSLGEPPTRFTWQYRDKDKKFHREKDLTPTEFREKFVSDENLDYVEICNSPVHKFGQVYKNRYGWQEIDGVSFANVDMDTIEKLILKQLKVGDSVKFYAMAGRDMPKSGYMSPNVYDFANLFDVDFAFTKADRILTREDLANHDMLIVAADIVDGVAQSYKVENSWGEDYGQKGFNVMSRDWACENLWGVVIKRDLLPEPVAKIFDRSPIVLEPWQTF